ncbi:MAG: DUF4118 domain-containing protein [Chloroflexales bacterium]
MNYTWATLIVVICTGVAAMLHPFFNISDLALVYLPGIVLVASRFGRGPSVLASCLSVLALNFFFTQPYFTLFVDNPRVVLTLVVILLVALVISTLTTRTHEQTDAAQRAAMQVETERLRNSLLSSVSHDLRTPLAGVTGALSSTLEGWQMLDDSTRIDLIQNAYDESERLSRLLTNLLEMTRLEAGGLTVRKEWQPMEEVVGAALTRLETRLRDRLITVNLPPDLPLVPLDAVLIEQVLLNLLENALKHTPPASQISISAIAVGAPQPTAIQMTVADRGLGLRPGDEWSIFEKFNRGTQPSGGGTGLGLTICQGIVRVHGGQIWAERRPEGGAAFIFTLPISGVPPRVELEPEPSPCGEEDLV